MKIKKIIITVLSVLIMFGCITCAAVISDGYFNTPFENALPGLQQEKTEDWELILVNSKNPLPKKYDITLTKLSNGNCVDDRIYPPLQKMFDEARRQGVNPIVREGYRTRNNQEEIMNNRIDKYISQGCSKKEAKSKAHEEVAKPGTSEHELGLAVDINAGDGSTPQQVYTWLSKNAYKYGFILRYPHDKEEITGIEYEPWHYRYVGKEAAKEIHEQQITLEEYLQNR